MKYNDMPFFKQYKCCIEEKKENLEFVEYGKSYVIFFDGQNATKNHNYDMFSKESFTYYLENAAAAVCNRYGLKAIIYAIIDEVTIIIPKDNNLIEKFGYDKMQEILTLFTQEVCRIFWKNVDCNLKGTMYQIKEENIDKLLALRKEVAKVLALEYFAKEYLDSSCYHEKSIEEIENALKENNLYDKYKDLETFREGIFEEIKSKQVTANRKDEIFEIEITNELLDELILYSNSIP